ncbi:MAG: hypothetical protein ACLFNU_07445 [Bacteroidales bacterium]
MTKDSNKNQDSNRKFSIREFINIFGDIDEKILQLHQCSSDDFLGLNTDFKQYYNQSKLISSNATNIFNELAESETAALIKRIETLYKDLKAVQTHFTKKLDRSISDLKEMLELLDKIFFPVKNLNQDLLTLKFLLANLKISDSTSDSSNLLNNEKVIHGYNEVINRFKVCGYQNEVNLETLKDNVKGALSAFEDIRGKNIIDLDNILNNIHYGIILFAEKHEEVARLIPEVTKKTENSSKSIADIITNLQYHDIIRQKMEHVHSTHKKLIVDLEKTANEQNNDSLQNHQKMLVRIRDIANLQSAQLVHANKEYQKAIETITNKFIAISNDMTNISEKCHEINISQDNAEEFHLQGIIEKLSNSATVLSLFLDAEKSFYNRIDIISNQVTQTSSSISKYSLALKELEQATAVTLKAYNIASTKDQEITKPLQQVENLYSEILKFKDEIQSVFSKVEQIGGDLSAGIQSKELKQNGSFGQSATSMNSIISQLNQKNLQIKDLLQENRTISTKISKDVRETIGKVRYYDFFEKVIVDIISEFNHIYKMLRAEITQDDSEKEKEYEQIKSQYTMASEHQIHDKITQDQGDVDLFGDDEFDSENADNKEDDDNFELF